MANQEPSKTGLFVTIGLFVITCLVTIWLFHYLIEPQNRSETFAFTLTFVCLLEFLSFGYFATLMIPNFRKKIVGALYPVIGVIIGLYVAVSLVVIVAYNILTFLINSPKAYFTTLTVESILFLILLGSIIVLNSYKKVEDTVIESERRGLINLSVTMQELYQNFLNHRSYLDIQTYRDIETKIRKLKERFQFCTPFGRSNKEVSNIEEEIQNYIVSLGKMSERIPSKPKDELGSLVKDIEDLTMRALQAMERREKLLMK